MNKQKEFFRVVRCGTLEELADALNYYLSKGWFVESLDECRTEFFQEHIAVMVNQNYIEHKQKYNALVEKLSSKPSINISLHKESFQAGSKRKVN